MAPSRQAALSDRRNGHCGHGGPVARAQSRRHAAIAGWHHQKACTGPRSAIIMSSRLPAHPDCRAVLIQLSRYSAVRFSKRRPMHQLVVQAALHQQLALDPGSARPCPLPRCGARRRCRERSMARPCSRATAEILAAGPTRIGTIMPASAASIGPRSRAFECASFRGTRNLI